MFLNTQENVKNAPLFTLSYSPELSQASHLLRKRNRETKRMQSSAAYITTLIVTMVMFCNQIMTQHKKKFNLSY